MKTIFCVFQEYDQAKDALQKLADQRFNDNYFNVIVLEQVAKNAMGKQIEKMHGGHNTKRGNDLSRMERMLAGKKPVTILNSGTVYAAGELAALLAKTAAAETSGNKTYGLVGALVDFGIPKDHSLRLWNEIKEGGFLIFFRTEDEQAPEAASLLRSLEGSRHINQVG